MLLTGYGQTHKQLGQSSGAVKYCSTMWVGCQSRWFLCLCWRETRQRILGPEISPYPEVGRGREWELAGKRSWRGTRTRAVGVGQQRGEQQRVGVEPRTGAVNTGLRRQRRQDRVQWRRSTQDVCIRGACGIFTGGPR